MFWKCLICATLCGPNIRKFRLEETEIEEVGSFIYVGSVVSVKGGTKNEKVRVK
jgi:hypothetical protein